MRRITTPLTKEMCSGLKSGEEALLTGTIYTARDVAHKELTELIRKKRRLPFDLKGAVIYYAGPTPMRGGGSVAAGPGSSGPTPARGSGGAATGQGSAGLTAAQGGGFGSCGPTTSSRMDKFTPLLLKMGLRGMIGKGKRSSDVKRAIKKEKAIYFLAIGGAGAYLAKKIRSAEILAFKKLGPEAIYKLEVRDFPLIVGINSKGDDIYK